MHWQLHVVPIGESVPRIFPGRSILGCWEPITVVVGYTQAVESLQFTSGN